MLFFWILLVILLVLFAVVMGAANFFVNVALFKSNNWYDTTGHKMMNPDNFQKGNSVYDETEQQQIEAGNLFWNQNFAKDYWLNIRKERLYSRLFLSNPNSHKWVICVHGYRSYGQRDMAYVASEFSKRGFNSLIPDLKAHGQSSGEIIGMGWTDRLDILHWINEVIAMDAEAEIILFGGSMGAATVMMASGERLPENVKAIIADCGYSSVYKEFSKMLRQSFKLPEFPIMTAANYLAKKKVGYSLSEASSIRQLHKNKLPVLFIHGTGDKFVPHEMIYENMEATTGVKESLIVENAPHLSSFIYEPDHYFGTVFEFIKRYC